MDEIAEEVRLRRALGRHARQSSSASSTSLLGPLARGRPGRRPGRDLAHGRRRHLHRSGRARWSPSAPRLVGEEGRALHACSGTSDGSTHQMSQSVAAVSRALHIVDDRLGGAPAASSTRARPAGRRGGARRAARCRAWWVEPVVAATTKVPGRVLHAACGDGWLVRRIEEAGGDAYGVDPRRAPGRVGRRTAPWTCAPRVSPTTCGRSPMLGLGAVVLERDRRGMAPASAAAAGRVGPRLAPGGTRSSIRPRRGRGEAHDVPPEADRARTAAAPRPCAVLLEEQGVRNGRGHRGVTGEPTTS